MFDLEIHREFSNFWNKHLACDVPLVCCPCPCLSLSDFLSDGFNHHKIEWSKNDEPEDDRLTE